MNEFTVLFLDDASFCGAIGGEVVPRTPPLDSPLRYEVLVSSFSRVYTSVELADRISKGFWRRDFDIIVGSDSVNHGTIRTLQRAYIQDIPYVALWRRTTLTEESCVNLSNIVSAFCVYRNFFLDGKIYDKFFENLKKIASAQMFEAIQARSVVLLSSSLDVNLRETYENFYHGEKTKETGVVKRIKEALSQGALTKKQLFCKIGWFSGDYWGGTRRRALINGVNFKYVGEKPVYYLEEKDLEKLDLKEDLAGAARIFTICSCGKRTASRVQQITFEEKQLLKECIPGIRFQCLKLGELE